MPSLILRTATRLLVGLILTFAVFLLLRGHNAPGGGFSAALVAGTGFALFAIVEGPAVVRRAIRVAPLSIAMGGLGLAVASGLVGALSGRLFSPESGGYGRLAGRMNWPLGHLFYLMLVCFLPCWEPSWPLF